jgi:carnitine monooxygenase subunit
LANWHHFKSQHIKGANWKLAFDAHLEFYHLPVLHRNTFGADKSNMAEYFQYGPHQRLGLLAREDSMQDQADFLDLAGLPTNEWPTDVMLFGEWIIFPNVSINCFDKGGRCVIISQVLPGNTVDESVTVQMFLYEQQPIGEQLSEATALTEFLGQVVGEEDMPMSDGQQQVVASGLLPEVQFGRNEGGLQHFHIWLNRFVTAHPDATMEDIISCG